MMPHAAPCTSVSMRIVHAGGALKACVRNCALDIPKCDNTHIYTYAHPNNRFLIQSLAISLYSVVVHMRVHMLVWSKGKGGES